MPRGIAFAFRTILAPAAFTALTVFLAPVDVAFGGGPDVTVVNPDTSPVPTTVVNPATNPVPTSRVDDPGRTPYASTGTSESSCVGSAFCIFTFTRIPQNYRLVIQHISGNMGFKTNPTVAGVAISAGPVGSANTPAAFFAPIFTSNDSATGAVTISQFDQPVLLYIDALGLPLVSVTGFSATAGATAVLLSEPQVTLSGYLLVCSTSPCAAIVQ
jgi:hypothetical protein